MRKGLWEKVQRSSDPDTLSRAGVHSRQVREVVFEGKPPCKCGNSECQIRQVIKPGEMIFEWYRRTRRRQKNGTMERIFGRFCCMDCLKAAEHSALEEIRVRQFHPRWVPPT